MCLYAEVQGLYIIISETLNEHDFKKNMIGENIM